MGAGKSPPEKRTDIDEQSESSAKTVETPDLDAKRASILQLYRYASPFDLCLVVLGCVVAMVTGVGFPFLSIIIGNVSQAFIVLENARLQNDTDAGMVEAREKFKHDVIQACIHYAIVGVVIMASSFIQIACFMVSCENVTNRMRRAFFKAIMRQDISWYDRNHSGTLATKLFDSMERVREGLGDKMGLMFQFSAQFFGGLIVALTYDWKLTLIMMALSPVLIICGAFMARMMASATAAEMKKYAVAGQIAEEVLTSIRTVFAFNGQERECRRYDQALEAGKIDGYKKSVYIGIGLASTMIVIFSTFCLAFWVGTDYIYWGMTSSADVLTVFFSVMMGSMAMGNAGQQFGVLGVALGAAGVVFQVIDREPEIDSYSEEGQKPKQIRGEVRVENLHFRYPSRKDVPILKGISLTCAPGETVALVGSSGCGKSTIVQLLLRYYNPDEGKITIDGIPIEELNIEWVRRAIGVVSQEPVLFNTTILENLRYGNPDATDATSALDAESESVVQAALENASIGRTTIVIAHRLSTIRNANKIIAMKNGNVVEVGNHEELLKNKGLYYELVNAQVFADVEPKGGRRGSTKETTRQISRQMSRKSTALSQMDAGIDVDEFDKKKETELERLRREAAEDGAEEQNLLKILKYARSEWWLLVIGSLACVIQGAVFPVFSLFFTQIMQVFAEPDPEVMRRDGHHWALMFLALAAVQGSTMLIQSTFYGVAAERLTMRLRSKVFRNVLRQDGAYFDHPAHSPGKISTRLATDAPNVKAAIDYRIGSVFNAAVALTAGIGIAFYYGWQMALLMLALMPLVGVAQSLRVRLEHGRNNADTSDLEASGKIAMEAVENIRTVQALTLERTLHDKFGHHLDGPHRSSTRKALVQGVAYAVANSVMFFLSAAEYRFGAWLIMDHHISNPINVMRVMMAIQFSSTSLGFASAYFPEYAKAKFAAGLIFKMLGENPLIDNLTRGGKLTPIHGAVTFKDVRFKYPQRPEIEILKGMNLKVNPGETLALVGASGCGKSTVVQLLERFYDPNNGFLEVDGEDIKQLNPQHLRKHIALVSQEPILFDCSIKENIIYALDTESEKLVQDALDKASQGRTCIVIAHRLSTVVNANCIMVVSGGQVIEQGTHNELMALRGAYFNLNIKQQTKQQADNSVAAF
ncbi:unnamed protein product, partial [Mesorhabditis spiculigera]